MEQDHGTHLKLARLYLENHWLSHAKQKCQEAIALGSPEAETVLNETEQRLEDESLLNLSLDHAPLAVLLDKECIISTLHFRHLESDRLKQEAFRQGVYYIDLETSSQCNRTCQYCPNSQNDRLSSNHFIEDSTFVSFIDDLQVIGYSKELHFVGYNEPLLYIENLLGRIAFARKKLPRARIVVFTNGDYLESDGVDQLITAGANEILISVHLAPKQPYNDASVFARINKIAARLGASIIPMSYVKDTLIKARLVHDAITITIQQTDYERLGSNRAGTLDGIGPQTNVRTSACLMPVYQFIVGHEGAVVPCCVMVSDDPRNAQFIVGKIGKTASTFDTYCNRSFVAWRRSLFNLEPKKAPCDKCNWDISMPLLNAPAIYAPWQHLVSPPISNPVILV